MKKTSDVVLIANASGLTTPASGANVTVFKAGGAILASLFSDDGITATSNPVVADPTGRYSFYVADGRYDVQFSGTGFATYKVLDLDIFDADDITLSGKTPIVGNLSFTGNNTHSGTENFNNLSSILFVGPSPAFSTIELAINALPTSGGTVFVIAPYVATLNSTAVYPSNVRIVFLGTGNIITCNTGAAPCVQFNGGQISIDGFSVLISGAVAAGTTYLRGTSTAQIFDLDWVASTNSNIIGNAIRNITIDNAGSTAEALLARSFYYLTLENLEIKNAQGNGYHFQDDKPSSINNLVGRFLVLRNVHYGATGGTGIGFFFDSSNGAGISEVHGDNLHCDMVGAQQCAKFLSGPSATKGQNSQMTFNSWSIFNKGSAYALQFDSPTGSTFANCVAGTTGCNSQMVFNEVNIENSTANPGTQTLPAVGCTVNSSASGVACAGFTFNTITGYGYQGGTWPDGVDYANLGVGSWFTGTVGQNSVIGRAGTINGPVLIGPTTFSALGTPSNGIIVYCSDCTIANPCAGSGTGAMAKRLNNIWVCN